VLINRQLTVGDDDDIMMITDGDNAFVSSRLVARLQSDVKYRLEREPAPTVSLLSCLLVRIAFTMFCNGNTRFSRMLADEDNVEQWLKWFCEAGGLI